jgi:knotted carbamoyltransferase YgeW
MNSVRNILSDLEELSRLNFDTYGKDFLLNYEKSDDDIKAVILCATILRTLFRNNISTRVFDTGLAISQFKDKSTRTRFSFASAANLLGLTHIEFDESKTQVAHGETIRETSNMISFLAEVIGIRDDMFIGKGHTYMLEVGKALDEGFQTGVLNIRPPIINLQCDIDHPTQTLSDLMYIRSKCNYELDNLAGKKIAVSWAYSPSYGKPLSVPQGLITLLTRFGMDVVLAYPEGYDLLPETIEIAKKNAEKSKGSFKIVHSMEEAFKDADFVYPKSWAPFEVMKKRTELYEKNDQKALNELEKECLQINKKYINWTCDEKKMKLTKNGNAWYMHCLPADISGVNCENGEVSAEIFEKYRIETYFEARYKTYVIASMILLARVRDPISILDHLYRKNNRRIGIIF